MNIESLPNPARLLRRSTACLLAASALGLVAPVFSQSQNAAILQDHVPAAVKLHQAAVLKSLASTKQLSLGLNLPLRNEAQLDQLLTDLYNPQSPLFHHYLSVKEFTARFAPTQQDYDQVVAWAKANDLAVTTTPANRRLVSVKGSVAAINRAFHLTLQQYRHPSQNRLFFAPDREPKLTGLAVPLLHITGLDNYVLPFNHLRHKDKSSAVTANASRASSGTGSGPNGNFLPSDIRAAYYGSGPLTGAGQTVGILSFYGYLKSDLDLFYSKTGQPNSVPVKNVLVDGFDGSCGDRPADCSDGEQILDIVNAAGLAPGLDQILFYEGDSATTILNQIAADNTAKAISSSWGGGDFGRVDDPIYKEFQAQGQTFVSASGDDGAYTSRTWLPPSLDPNITDVGGTHLDTHGPGGTWAGESAWSGSSGGYLAQAGYATPSYQQLPGVINASNRGSTRYRNDPDIALEGDFDNVTVDNGEYETDVAGTSYAAPRLAGLIALANEQAVNNGQGPVGFLNPTLYNLGTSSNYLGLFHDITVGNNRGFNAVPGYDLVTGWGSPIGPAFINALLAR